MVPVCYGCNERAIYVALDAKPKRVAPERLKRVRNILQNPEVALVVDRYDEDWSRLAYLLVRGTAELIWPDAAEHARAVELVRSRYPQYHAMPLETQPVIAIRPQSVVVWGTL